MRYTVVEEIAVQTGESTFTHYDTVGAEIDLADELAAPFVESGHLVLIVAEPAAGPEVTEGSLAEWLAAEEAHNADVGEWLEAEVEHLASKRGRSRRGEGAGEA